MHLNNTWTIFSFFETERICRWKFQIWRKCLKVIQMSRKHCGKMEKLLATSNFSFSHSDFKRLVSQGCQKVSLCGNGLIHILQILSIWTIMKFCSFVNSLKDWNQCLRTYMQIYQVLKFFVAAIFHMTKFTKQSLVLTTPTKKVWQCCLPTFFLHFPQCFLPYQKQNKAFK